MQQTEAGAIMAQAAMAMDSDAESVARGRLKQAQGLLSRLRGEAASVETELSAKRRRHQELTAELALIAEDLAAVEADLAKKTADGASISRGPEDQHGGLVIRKGRLVAAVIHVEREIGESETALSNKRAQIAEAELSVARAEEAAGKAKLAEAIARWRTAEREAQRLKREALDEAVKCGGGTEFAQADRAVEDERGLR